MSVNPVTQYEQAGCAHVRRVLAQVTAENDMHDHACARLRKKAAPIENDNKIV